MKQLLFSSLILLTACSKSIDLNIKPNQTIALIGNNLCSRMMNYGYFETEVQLMFPESQLTIRNMCDGGDTPGFRPHSGRNTPWAFPGAEKFQTELATNSRSEGHFEYPDEWLTRLKTDVILAFFGYNESFAGKEGLENFKGEMDAFIKHTLQQKYNGTSAPQLVLVSPIAFEDLSDRFDLPNGKKENENLKLYSDAIKEVAAQNQVPFVDVFTSTKKWFAAKNDLTIDGFQLNDEGYRKFSQYLAKSLFGKKPSKESEKNRDLVHEAVMEKNWFWHNDYKIPNGVHVFGRRYNPFGPDNYPAELQKIREMTAIRDTAIWKALKGEVIDLAAADQKTTVLAQVETNYKEGDEVKKYEYLYGEDALASFTVPEGYKIELFASEQEFPELANPVQISFDNKGRLWVATMPTYPHYRPGDARPNDKILIFEDTDKDGKADRQIVFADGLHIPAGFEIAPEGVYVSQGTNLILLVDKDGDDKADVKEILLSGFDDHDTHHVISAFCADPSGAIFMGEGVFLHTNVETPYGPVRATNGGFMRYNPARKHLERTAQMSIPNPWGIAFDDWGQNFFLETSGPALRWMMPSSMKNVYGVSNPSSPELIEPAHRVRPTSGLEFISSRHFPDEVQGDIILANTIGFLGIKQHTMAESGTGYQSSFRQDLLKSSDGNFRPVDLEFAPDGSLYLIDWHNVLVGHMQHNARDPLRDHVHGRIYRITYPSRPLVEPAKISDASIPELYENLKLPEYRTRYRTRRELRGRDSKSVLDYLEHWKVNNSGDEKALLEGLWVSWGLNKVDGELLKKLLKANDHKVRAAAVRVLRYTGHQIPDQKDLLMEAARDNHGRVRLEAMVAGTWLDTESANLVVAEAAKNILDEWIIPTFTACLENINKTYATPETVELGKSIYERDGYCQTCHQADGKGLEASGFPGLAGTDWVTGDEERLIKITLKGLIGPIEVNGKKYPGQVPMTPFEGLLNDEEVAAVLSYIRSSFGNQAGPITAEKVGQVRKAIADKKGYYTPEEL